MRDTVRKARIEMLKTAIECLLDDRHGSKSAEEMRRRWNQLRVDVQQKSTSEIGEFLRGHIRLGTDEKKGMNGLGPKLAEKYFDSKKGADALRDAHEALILVCLEMDARYRRKMHAKTWGARTWMKDLLK